MGTACLAAWSWLGIGQEGMVLYGCFFANHEFSRPSAWNRRLLVIY